VHVQEKDPSKQEVLQLCDVCPLFFAPDCDKTDKRQPTSPCHRRATKTRQLKCEAMCLTGARNFTVWKTDLRIRRCDSVSRETPNASFPLKMSSPVKDCP
jgi:hypothetical protein